MNVSAMRLRDDELGPSAPERRILPEGTMGMMGMMDDKMRSNKRKRKRKDRPRWEVNCPVKWLLSGEEAAVTDRKRRRRRG